MTVLAGRMTGAWPAPLDDAPEGGPAAVPHVIAWNLTRRCNLACAHCYIAAGSWHAAEEELGTPDCLRIVDEILAVNPAPLIILSGGEPLLREDLEEIAGHAARRGATVVVGTNGTRLTDQRIASLQAAGVSGVAVSVDSLDPVYHDRFRHGEGALADTTAAVGRLRAHGLDFIVQTTVTRGNRDELATIAEWAVGEGAVAFNVYFLVATGRGEGMRGLDPDENEEVLGELVALEQRWRGRMMVRSKCMPAIMRRLHQDDSDSPLLAYATRCPCGVQYCRITPDGKVTPCPYLPVVAGDLGVSSFGEIWERSETFARLREGPLGGRCGACEYRVVCGGCRARAYAEADDPLAEDPACGYVPPGDRALVVPRSAVRYGDEAAPRLPWDDDARARLERVPSFVRAVVASRVETFAAGRGHARVTTELLDEVRSSMPVDFSKARPFFLRKG
jgi:radical SAM protein with 4Fe4S-binding SPASM domain